MRRAPFIAFLCLSVLTPPSIALSEGCENPHYLLLAGGKPPATSPIQVNETTANGTRTLVLKHNGTDIATLPADGVKAFFINDSSEQEMPLSEEFTLGPESWCVRIRAGGETFIILWKPIRVFISTGPACEEGTLSKSDDPSLCLQQGSKAAPWPKSIPLPRVQETLSIDAVRAATGVHSNSSIIGDVLTAPPFANVTFARLASDTLPVRTGASLSEIREFLTAAEDHEESRTALAETLAKDLTIAALTDHLNVTETLVERSLTAIALTPEEGEKLAENLRHEARVLLAIAATPALTAFLSPRDDCESDVLRPTEGIRTCFRRFGVAELSPNELPRESHNSGGATSLVLLGVNLPPVPPDTTVSLAPIRIDLGFGPESVHPGVTRAHVENVFLNVSAMQNATKSLKAIRIGQQDLFMPALKAAEAVHGTALASISAILPPGNTTASLAANSEDELQEEALAHLEPQLTRQRFVLVGAGAISLVAGLFGSLALFTRSLDAERARAAFKQVRGPSRTRLAGIAVISVSLIIATGALFLAEPSQLVPFIVRGSP